jgi:hypothetical protein
VAVYRIYKLNAQGHVTGHALVLICEKDADVIRKVESLVDGHDVEILDGGRLVDRLKSVASSPTKARVSCFAQVGRDNDATVDNGKN